MDKLTKEILEILKRQYTEVVGHKPFQNTSEAREYYLENLDDNLYEPMSPESYKAYSAGSGNEISSGKMNSLRSSSALTYNLFSGGTATIADSVFFKHSNLNLLPGEYSVEFEKQYHTLKPSVSNRPANLDAFLYNSDKSAAIAVEVKMTEWIFNKPGNLKSAYLDKNSYINEEAGNVFVSVARSLTGANDYDDPADAKAEYSPYSTHYDTFQMFKHAVACYTACVNKKEEARPIKKLTLLNILWRLGFESELSDESQKIYSSIFNTENMELKIFLERMQPVKKLFADIGVEFDIEAMNSSYFPIFFNLSQNKASYLVRYFGDRNTYKPSGSTLYAKLQDVDLTKFDREAMSKLQVLGFSLTDIIDDCITVKETKGFGNTETLDFLIPELNNTVFWNDDKDTYSELIRIVKWACK